MLKMQFKNKIQATKTINSNNTGLSTTKSNKCAGANCSNQGVQSCKQCNDKGRTVMFCSITCLSSNYDTHKLIHK